MRKSITQHNGLPINLLPKNLKRKSFKTQKWFKNALKNLRAKRNKAHLNWKQHKTTSSFEWFKFLRDKFEESLTACVGDSRQTYKLLNDLSGKSVTDRRIPLHDSCKRDNPLATDYNIAERFNNFLFYWHQIEERTTSLISCVSQSGCVSQLRHSLCLSECFLKLK